MKVTGVETTAFTYPIPLLEGPVSACLIELHTDEGLTGIGIGLQQSGKVTEKLAAEMLLGEDPRAVVALWQRMVDAHPGKHHDDLVSAAIAVLDVALWDLKAKANDEPLWKTLGGSRPNANAYASDPRLDLTDEQVSEWYGAMARQHGFHEGKLKVGRDQQADLTHLGMMRDALSGASREPVLMIDAGGRWKPAKAIQYIGEMEEEFDLTWVESPVDDSDLQGSKRISENVFAAVCSGKNLHSTTDYLPFFQHQALDVVQVDIALAGITGALQIADAAYGLELPATLCESPGNIAAHVAAAMPNFMSLEVVGPETAHGIFTSDICIENGRAVAGNMPGNGLSVDRGSLAASAVDKEPK